MNLAKMHADRKDHWETPAKVFDPLNEIYRFRMDLAATKKNSKCELFRSRRNSFFKMTAAEVNAARWYWMNPPFKAMGVFLQHLAYLHFNGWMSAVVLMPASLDCRWFHNHVLGIAACYTRKGRISYIDPDTGKPKSGNTSPSILAVYRHASGPKPEQEVKRLRGAGWERLR